jgi:RNase P/RNase MRP subunit p29
VEVVVDRLIGDDIVVVQSASLRIGIAGRIVTIIGDDYACRMEQIVVESAIFMVPGGQGEEHIVAV